MCIILIIIGLVLLIVGVVFNDWNRLSHRDEQLANATDGFNSKLVKTLTTATNMIERDNETLINDNRVRDNRISEKNHEYYGRIKCLFVVVLMLLFSPHSTLLFGCVLFV